MKTTDYYYSAPTIEALGLLVCTGAGGKVGVKYDDNIGIMPGRAAVPAGQDEQGNPITAIPAAGDPALFYLAIRTADIITTPPGVTLVTDGSGQEVLGVFL